MEAGGSFVVTSWQWDVKQEASFFADARARLGGHVTCFCGGLFVSMNLPKGAFSGPATRSPKRWEGRIIATVLIVDDRDINRKVAGLQLERLGCSFVEASCGEQALDLVKVQKFDLILMDLQMPGLSGAQTTELVRQGEGQNAKTPIVAFTGHVSGNDLDHALAAGMTDYLAKPASAKDVERILREHLRGPQNSGHGRPRATA